MAETTTTRKSVLLGHPQKLSVDEVKERRALMAGLPVLKTDAAAYGPAKGIIGDEFAINVCDLIVAEAVAALNVVAVTSDDQAARQFVWDCWERSELSANTEGLFTAACGDGQAFLVLGYGPDGKPSASVNAAYDGDTGIEVKGVDGDGILTTAVKHEIETLAKDTSTGFLITLVDWFKASLNIAVQRDAMTTVERKRRTVYLYDRDTDTTTVRYFITDPGKAEYEVNEDDEWIETGTGGSLWPYGMPVVAFVAPGGGELSELESPQRLVNSAALDLAATASIDALRIGWTMDCAPLGGGDTRTKKGAADKVYLTPGAWFQLQSDTDMRQGSIGTIPPADLVAQRENLKLQVELALLLGRTPTFLLPWNAVGAPPSGAALRLANGSFSAKVERYQERWGVVFGHVFSLWQRMAKRAAVDVKPAWRPIRYTTRTEDLADAVVADTIGLPKDIIATDILALTPEQAERYEAEQKAVADERAAMVAAMQKPASGGDASPEPATPSAAAPAPAP